MKPESPEEPQQQTTPSSHEPVAYDKDGRPLYAHPPQQQSATQPPQPQVVYMSRPLKPHQPHIPEEIRSRCEESHRKFPNLNLSEGEYVISAIRRHPIGLVSIWGVAGLIIVLLFTGITFTLLSPSATGILATGGQSLAIILLLVSVLAFLGGIVATIVYNANRFYLTNESVVQNIQTSLFSKKEQTISLANIEDASYRQQGFIQHLFNYGSLRLSTEGDETTYRFNYVAHPQKQIMILNNAVEAFKNGRPVEMPKPSN